MARLLSSVAFAPEGEGAGGGGGEGEGSAAPETILFGNDGKPDAAAGKEGEGSKPAGEGEGAKPEGEGEQGKADDWKEYVPDPNKTDEENAAAKAEHDKTKPADPNDTTVPETYDLKMPEGVEVDQPLLDALTPVFKDLFLTQAQAQGLADAFIKHRQAQAEEYANQPEGQWSMSAYEYFKEQGTPDTWPDKAKADKEIGGAKWDGTVSSAQRAVSALGTPELKAYLDASGAGNHPELIRYFAKVGALIKEDTPPNGGAEGSGKPADPAHILFKDDAPKG